MTNPNRYYAGIGSRRTPPDILKIMQRLAAKLEADGWILRSGGAKGADSAFEAGVKDPAHKEIYLPWNGFLGRQHNPSRGVFAGPRLESWDEAMKTLRFHPAPERLQGINPANGRAYDNRGLMARNAYQVLGPDLAAHSRMVVAWTPGGLGSGGTGQAIRIADHYNIPVRDLGNHGILYRTLQYLEA